jgi:hypothetical protein
MFGITPVNALWLLLALCFVWMLYRFQKYNTHFDVADMFMTYSVRPPRADLTSVIIFMMALMFIWVCVERVARDKDVDNLVLGGLTIFVIRQAFKIGADAYSAKPAAPEPDSPSRDVNVNVTQPANPLAKSGPVPVQVANPEPIKVTQTAKKAKKK